MKRWRITLVIAIAFVLALAGTVVFAARAHRMARQLRRQHEPIQAWMPVPFIAHSHHIPAAALFQAIGVQPLQPRDRRSLEHIARDTHRPVSELIGELQHAVDATAQPSGGPPK